MKLGPEKLQAQLDKKLKSVYLIAGDDPLLVAEAATMVRTSAKAQGFGERVLHVAERGFDWSALAAESRNLSLFADKRITEVRLPTAKPGTDGSKALIAMAEDPAPDSLLLVVAGQMDGKFASTKWVKHLDAAGVFVAVRNIPIARLPQWVQQRMVRRGLKPLGDAARIIAERCEGNLLAADQEIEKLLLTHGEGSVDEETVIQSVTDCARYDVFQLADAALVGDTARAIHVLEGLFAEGVAAPLILWSLERELRTLAKLAWMIDHGARAADAMAKTRVWSSRQPAFRRAMARHNKPGAFIELLGQAAQADRIAKGAQFGDAQAELGRLVACFCGTALPQPLADVA